MPEAETGWTLGALQRGGYGLDAICRDAACRKLFSFDVVRLVEGLGEDHPLPSEIDGCPACGGVLDIRIALGGDDPPRPTP